MKEISWNWILKRTARLTQTAQRPYCHQMVQAVGSVRSHVRTCQRTRRRRLSVVAADRGLVEEACT